MGYIKVTHTPVTLLSSVPIGQAFCAHLSDSPSRGTGDGVLFLRIAGGMVRLDAPENVWFIGHCTELGLLPSLMGEAIRAESAPEGRDSDVSDDISLFEYRPVEAEVVVNPDGNVL